jgi:vitamin B12 transporter
VASVIAASGATAQTPQSLPAIVVEGGTLEPPRARPQPTVSDTPAPAPKKRAAPGAAAPPPGGGAAAPQTGSAAEGGEAGGAGAGSEVAGQPAETVGSAVTVVTGAELRARQIRYASEAIRSLPGVSLNRSGGPASLTEVRIRGAEANHTLVLIDGIRANSASDGQFDLSDLQVEDIERIEVLRGGHSALHGSGAVGGVINIITRGGRGPLRIVARGEAGSFGTYDGALRISGGTDRASGAITIQRQTTNGFNVSPAAEIGEEDGSRQTSVSGRASVTIAPGLQLDLSLRDVSKRLERDDQTGFAARGGFIVLSDSLSVSTSRLQLFGASMRWDMLDGKLTHLVRAERNSTSRADVLDADFGFGFGFPSRFANLSTANTLGYQATYRFDTPALLGTRHSLTGLVEREREAIETEGDFTGRTSGSRARLATALEWRGEFARRLFLTLGLRRDDNETLEDATTWRAALSVPIPEIGIRPHASAGTAVKLPTLFEQFGSAANFVRNPNLKNEESFGWDAGVELTFLGGRARLDVTYFDAELENKIANQNASMFDPGRPFDCNPGDLFCSRSINVPGISKRRGVEVEGRMIVLPGLEIGAAYTWLDAVDGLGEREVRRAPHSGRLDLAYAFNGNRGRVGLSAVYNGRARDNVFATAPFFFFPTKLTLDDYWVLSATAAYKLKPGVEIFGRVENLLDTRYQEIFGFETAGVAAYAGMRFTFEDRSGLLAPAAR